MAHEEVKKLKKELIANGFNFEVDKASAAEIIEVKKSLGIVVRLPFVKGEEWETIVYSDVEEVIKVIKLPIKPEDGLCLPLLAICGMPYSYCGVYGYTPPIYWYCNAPDGTYWWCGRALVVCIPYGEVSCP